MSFTKTQSWLNCTSHLLLVVVVVQITLALDGRVSCLQFHYPDFTDSSGISFQRTANVSDSTAWLLPDPRPNWATDPNNDSATILWSGWMSYEDAIAFTGSANGKANSFNASFTFKLINGGDEDSPSGMAFFISPTGSRPDGAIHSYFGIGNDTFPARFFAVEFDTFLSTSADDPSSSHVGIDINSVNSSKIVDTSNNTTNPYYPQL